MKTSENANLWHQRLGHISANNMKKLKNYPENLDFQDEHDQPCIACAQGKLCKRPFKSSENHAKELLELVHSDVMGPLEVPSVSGYRYVLIFLDDHSRKIFVYFLRHKDEATSKFKEFKVFAEKQSDKQIKRFRTDNGGEYVNTQLSDFFCENGIQHEPTVPYNPQQNGRAERVNGSIMRMARCMLMDSNCPKKFWAEAVNTAVYLKNRCSHAALHDLSPEECWSGRKPKLGHLKVFGCRALAHVPKEKRKKLDAVSKELVMVGYGTATKGYLSVTGSG